MLQDAEWAEVEPHMSGAFEAIKDYRKNNEASLQEALNPSAGVTCRAFDLYFQFTGVRESDPNKLWHHHTSFFGPVCSLCGKLFRTSKARYCAACGHKAQPRVQADLAEKARPSALT